jgi:hypothetical protein
LSEAEEGVQPATGVTNMRKISVQFVISFLILAGSCAVFAQDTVNPPQPADPELLVPAGTVLPIILTTYLNSHSSQVDDTFYADVAYPLYIQQRLVIPKGSTVKGYVTQVVRPGRIKGKGRLAVRIDSIILPNGINRDLIAAFRGIHGPGAEKLDRKSETIKGEGSKGADAGTIVGTTSQGAFIGAITGGGSGAGIGAGAGAAVGLATILLTRGRDLVLEPGTQFDLELRQPLRFAYPELDFTNAQINSSHYTPQSRPRNDRNQQRPHRGFGMPWPY